MKEVACAVCGAMYRFPAADIPPAGKTVTCAKCKARIVVPGEAAGGTGDVIDLADLPAPRRAGPMIPPARSEAVDLPAPKGPKPSAIVDLPAPKAPAPRSVPIPREPEPFTLDGVDLVAPVGPTASAPAAAKATIGPHTNLPAPKVPAPIVDLPMPKAPGPIVDLPMPKAKANDLFADLPAPKGPTITDLPAPKGPPAIPNLPAPKRAGSEVAIPKPPLPPPPAPPTPPAAKSTVAGLPPTRAPGPAADLPAPKGFFDDLPGPAHTRGPELPAPKGFFDDLPGPAQTRGPELPAPKGFFDDLPGPAQTRGPELPAPKGFFDDLPGPAQTRGPELPAPKGFFDDLPGPAQTRGPELPAPKGFFDDLPAAASPSVPSQPKPVAARTSTADAISLFDDLPPPATNRSDRFAGTAPGQIELESIDLPATPGVSGLLELESTASGARMAPPPARTPPPPTSEPPPALELGDNDPLGLELPTASAAPARGGVSFKGGGSAGEGSAAPTRGGPAPSGDLDLAVDRRRERAAEGPKTKQKAARDEAAKPKLSSRATRIALVAALGLAAVGGGGFVMYRRWDAQKTKAADIDRNLAAARRALVANNRGHWRNAIRAAGDVLALDKKHREALGISAQAALAAYLEEGTDGKQRIATGKRFLDSVEAGGQRLAALDKAEALLDIVDGDTTGAIKALTPMAARDPDAQLYLGWAYQAAGQWAEATTAFTAALAARPIPATFGLAQAQAATGATVDAHASFLKVIAIDPEHVGALVGEVITQPGVAPSKREASLLAILQRQEIDKADPRAVVLAWRSAGDEARRGGRRDAARDRYRKALAIIPNDVGVLVSLAANEFADGKLDAATEATTTALGLAPDDIDGNLVMAQLELQRGSPSDAAARLSKLRARTPPIAGPEQRSRLEMIDGARLEAEKNPDAALAAYERAATSGPAGDVAPIIATATLLGRQADAAIVDKQPERAASLRAKADAKLAQIAAAAQDDPALAITLGTAYLAAGSPAQAEQWLRGAIDKRPSEVEAHYQLAEALRRQGKQDEAVATLVKAFELDPSRLDLGVELARGFEAASRDADAGALYKRLLQNPDVSVETRIRAGRFFARTGDITEARKLGDALLKITPDDPTGLFLKAEGLLADGRYSEARRTMQEATSRNQDPQFLDGLGRANEALAGQSNDTAIRDEALRAYDQVTKLDPKILNAWVGVGRIRLARGEYDKALTAYEAALKLDPGNADVPYGMGKAYVELDDAKSAIVWLSRAVAAKPSATAYWELGKLYYEADRAGAAASSLDRATALATKEERDTGIAVPWLTEALWLLGTVQQVVRNDGATVRAWQAYLDRNPTNRAQADEVRRFLRARGQ